MLQKQLAKFLAGCLFDRLKIWQRNRENPLYVEDCKCQCWYADYTLEQKGLKRARVIWLCEDGKDGAHIDIDNEKEFDTIPYEKWDNLHWYAGYELGINPYKRVDGFFSP